MLTFRAIILVFFKMSRELVAILVRSVDMSKGDLNVIDKIRFTIFGQAHLAAAQKAKCVCCSVIVSPEFPTSSISKSIG